jgi:hypothetical protein
VLAPTLQLPIGTGTPTVPTPTPTGPMASTPAFHLLRQVACSVAAVVYIHDAPLARQPLAECAAIPRGTPVVDVRHGKACGVVWCGVVWCGVVGWVGGLVSRRWGGSMGGLAQSSTAESA